MKVERPDGRWFRLEEDLSRLMGDWAEAVPCLDDPATLGAFAALVRERADDPFLSCACTADGWRMCSIKRDPPGTVYATEAEAWVAAAHAVTPRSL